MSRPELTVPKVHCRTSFVAALQEFHAEGRYTHLDPKRLLKREEFASYVELLHRVATLPEEPAIAPGIPFTTLWYVKGADFIGLVHIRHKLTESLRISGGHIGYDVRPSARRAGHATRMLALALPIAHELGIDPALLTCDATNIASRKVIEANGGRHESPHWPTLHYWLPTGVPAMR